MDEKPSNGNAVRGMMLRDLAVKPFPDEDTFAICVSDVVSPELFYGQLATEGSALALQELTLELASVYSGDEDNACYTPQLNEICVAKFEDGNWYRASVIQYNADMTARMFFIDYGNKSDIETRNIKCIKEHLLKYPRMALKFSLPSIKSTSGFWSEEVAAFMKSESAVNLFTVKSLNIVHDLMECRIEQLEEKLVDNGYALLKPDEMVLDFPQDNSFECCIMHVKDTNLFHGQLLTKESIAEYGKVTSMLLNVMSNSSPIQDFSPSSGDICAGYHHEFHEWYRLKINSVGDDEVVAKLLDFGDEVAIKKSDLRPLPSQFFKIPIKGIPMCLFGAVPKEDNGNYTACIEKLKEHILQKSCMVDVMGRSEEALHVKISNDSIDTHDLLSDYLQILNDGDGPSKRIKDDDIPKLNVDDSGEILVTHVDNPTSFYVQFLKNIDLIGQLDYISDDITTRFKDSAGKYRPTDGEICGALFETFSQYFRCVVLEVDEKTERVKVRFIDYGNEAFVRFDDIAPLPKEYTVVPQQAVRFSLYENIQQDWPDQCIQRLRDLILNKPCSFTIVKRLDTTIISRVTIDGVDVAEQLSQFVVGDSTDERDSQRAESNEKVDQCTKQAVYHVPDECSVCVCHIESTSLFYCQINDLQNSSLISTLSQDMSNHCNALSSPYEPQVNELCCGLFDGVWCRCIVKSKDSKSANVFFIDFGNHCDLAFTDVRKSLPEFSRSASLAYACRLLVAPTAVSTSKFVELALNQVFGMKVVNRDTEVMEVDLFERQTGDNVIDYLSVESSSPVEETMSVIPTAPIEPPTLDELPTHVGSSTSIVPQATVEPPTHTELSTSIIPQTIVEPPTTVEPPTHMELPTSMAPQAKVEPPTTVELPTSMVPQATVESPTLEVPPAEESKPQVEVIEAPTAAPNTTTRPEEVAPPRRIMALEIPKTNVPKEGQLYAVHIEDVSNIYAQLIVENFELIRQLDEISNELTSTFHDSDEIYKPVVGEACTAFFPEFNQYFRCEAVQVNDSDVIVKSIDFGNSCTVTFMDVAPLPSQYANLPKQAVRFGLTDPGNKFNANYSERLQQLVLNQISHYTVKDIIDDLYIVDIQRKDDDGDEFNVNIRLAQEFSKMEVVDDEAAPEVVLIKPSATIAPMQNTPPSISDTETVASEVTPPADEEVPLNGEVSSTYRFTPSILPDNVHPLESVVMKMDIRNLSSGVFELSVTHAESPFLIYTRFDDPISNGQLEDVSNAMSKFFATCPQDQLKQNFKAGTLSAVNINGEWKRGIITKIEKTVVSVFLIDEGHEIDCQPKQLRPLLKQFKQLPAQAIPLKLITVKPISDDNDDENDWSDIVCKFLREFISGQTIRVRPEFKEGIVYGAKVKVQGNALENLLQDAGYAKIIRPQLPEIKSSEGSKSKSIPFSDISKIIDIERPTSDEFEGYITCVVSPRLFYCRLMDDEKEKKVEEISNYLETQYDGKEQTTTGLSDGDLCSLKLGDNKWYRGFILKIYSNDTANVWLVDFGSKYQVPISAIYPLPETFRELPAQCITAQLQYIIPPDEGSYSKEASERFKRLVVDRVLVFRTIKIHNTIFRVIIIDKKTGSNVGDKLVAEGFAKYVFDKKPPLAQQRPATNNQSIYHHGRPAAKESMFRNPVNEPDPYYVDPYQEDEYTNNKRRNNSNNNYHYYDNNNYHGGYSRVKGGQQQSNRGHHYSMRGQPTYRGRGNMNHTRGRGRGHIKFPFQQQQQQQSYTPTESSSRSSSGDRETKFYKSPNRINNQRPSHQSPPKPFHHHSPDNSQYESPPKAYHRHSPHQKVDQPKHHRRPGQTKPSRDPYDDNSRHPSNPPAYSFNRGMVRGRGRGRGFNNREGFY